MDGERPKKGKEARRKNTWNGTGGYRGRKILGGGCTMPRERFNGKKLLIITGKRGRKKDIYNKITKYI